jgi:hypothetical protein
MPIIRHFSHQFKFSLLFHNLIQIPWFSQQAALMGLSSSPFVSPVSMNGTQFNGLTGGGSNSLSGVGGGGSGQNQLGSSLSNNVSFSNGLNLAQQSLDALALQGHPYAPGITTAWDLVNKKRKESFSVTGIVCQC